VRILFLTPDLPVPPDQGAKLRSLALIQAAAEHHEVHVLSFESPHVPDGPLDASSLQAICKDVQLVPAPPPRSIVGRAFSMILGTDPFPDLARRLASAEFDEALGEKLAQTRFDVVQVEGLEMMGYHGAARAANAATKVIYDAHNAETHLQRTMAAAEARDPRRWHAAFYSLLQWSKLASYERIMVNAADMVLAVSEEDAAKLRGRQAEPRVVPNGVDADAVAYQELSAEPRRTMVFMGPLDYRPNADAARWLVRDVLPRIRKILPDARLRLVGRGSEHVHAEGVDSLGYVPDAAVELRRADALIVPMRMGSGTRFKVLEAMAAGVPVVSTPRGLAGISAEPGKHALVGRNPAELADAMAQALSDRTVARGIAASARSLVEQQYAWKRITPQYLKLLSEVRRTARP